MPGVISGLVFNQQFWGPLNAHFVPSSVISEHHHVDGGKPASTSTNDEKSGCFAEYVPEEEREADLTAFPPVDNVNSRPLCLKFHSWSQMPNCLSFPLFFLFLSPSDRLSSLFFHCPQQDRSRQLIHARQNSPHPDPALAPAWPQPSPSHSTGCRLFQRLREVSLSHILCLHSDSTTNGLSRSFLIGQAFVTYLFLDRSLGLRK